MRTENGVPRYCANHGSPVVAPGSSDQPVAGEVNAQIAVAVTAASIVPDRPRVLVQIYKGNHSHYLISQSRAFALNFLTRDQLHFIRDSAWCPALIGKKLEGVSNTPGITCSPILADCMGFLDCRVINAMDGGDMTCFLADVVDGSAHPDVEPISWREARRLIPPEWNEAWNAQIGAEIEVSRRRMSEIDYAAWGPSQTKPVA